jgi:hypothetical protein
VIVTNSIFWGNRERDVYGGSVAYSCTQQNVSGTGNINADPCFVDPCNGDYHLQCAAGRWDPNKTQWVCDVNTSRCIDAGKPNSNWTRELWPHGKQINMGTYGGTPEASMSLSSIGNLADLNADGFVDWLDLMLLKDQWLRQEVLLAEDLDRNGIVDFADFALFADTWAWEE